MAINKKLIHFKKFSDFNSKKLSANEANTQYTVGVGGTIQNGTPDVLYQSICWIKDTKQQWTHGQVYDFSDSDIYYTDFTADDVYLGCQGEGSNPIIVTHDLLNAINDNKVIIVPAGSTRSGYNMLYGKTDSEYSYRLAFIGASETIIYNMDARDLTGGYVVDLASDSLLTEIAYAPVNVGVDANSVVRRDDTGSINVIFLRDSAGKLCGLPTGNASEETYGDYTLQDKLISGKNIKTVNGQTLLGSGNITIEGGGGTSQFYITDFTISDLRQLVNGDLTEVSANCSALSQALQNNQIIVIPYGLTEDGYFGYSLPDVYYEDLLYMTITDSGSGTVYAIEVDTYSNYIHSDNVSIVNSNNEVIGQGSSAIDLKIDFDTLYEHYDRNRELDTIELNYTGCTDTLFRELTWEEVDSLIREGNYSFFTTNDFVDEYSDRISCPVVVGYDSQGGFKFLNIYSQVMGIPMYEYNYLITFMTGDYCTITRYRTGGYRQTNMGTSNVFHTLLPNEFYVWDEVTDLTIMLDPAWADSTIYTYTKEFLFQFTSGSESTTLSLPESIKWSNGEAPVIEANQIYQISILNGLGTVMSWDSAAKLKDNFISTEKNILTFKYPTASELTIKVYGRTTGTPSSHILTIPSGVSSYTASNLTNIIYITSVTPSSDDKYNYTYEMP